MDPISILVSSGANWAWDNLHELIQNKLIKIASESSDKGGEIVFGKIKDAWRKIDWLLVESKYRENLSINLSTTKILGNPKPICVDQIYTDVFLHEKITAYRRFSESIEKIQVSRQGIQDNIERHEAVKVAMSGQNLYILGKPGAGKTTYLKRLALLSCRGEINKTPIFVSLKDWSDSALSLIPYMAQQFDICGFPAADSFVEAMLSKGDVLLLMDGLDEVNEWQEKRSSVIREVVNFSKKYKKVQICLTCRIAASDYSFELFKYVEIADFTRTQQRKFIMQWYGDDGIRRQRFSTEWRRPAQRGLRELGKTPVLLTLICLAFDETLSFPTRIVDLYREAIEALLKKWDASRNIRRDEFYKNLASSRRENLLESIAAHFYFNSKFLFTKDELCEQAMKFVRLLPDSKESTASDGVAIIKSIEAQHGLLVERAVNIYSFSHLTFQEYFTARYIIQNQTPKMLDQVVEMGMNDQKWREVLLCTSGLMLSADEIISRMTKKIQQLRDSDEATIRFLSHALGNLHTPVAKEMTHPPLTIAELRKIADHLMAMAGFLDGKSKVEYEIPSTRTKMLLNFIKKYPSKAASLLGGYFARPEHLISYLYACRLLIECLEVSMTSRRESALKGIMALDQSDDENFDWA